jgi:transposase-like protein
MIPIPEFSELEINIIQSTVNERYRQEISLHLADVEVNLNADTQPVACPAVFWDQQRTSFVLIKTGENRYRCQFFGRDLQMYSTGTREYDDLAECMIALLQVQADHDRSRVLHREIAKPNLEQGE